MKAALFAAAVGLALLAPASASAQIFTSKRADNPYRSARRFALELRFGPYKPDVDKEFGGARTPYRDYFGDDRNLMTQVEVDYQIYNGFGSAGIGVSVGYSTRTAGAFYSTGDLNQDRMRSGDKTTFSLYPTALLAVYRADQLWQFFGIPVVPYGKAGFNYTFWSIYDGNGEVAERAMGGRGRGATGGWQASAGVSVVLDFIDPGSARELDTETGVNHTHLFFEWTRYAVSGLGQSRRLNVGDDTWAAGLMFEF